MSYSGITPAWYVGNPRSIRGIGSKLMTIENWTFYFNKMMAVEIVSDGVTREWYLMKLDDIIYVGQPNGSPSLGGGWSWQYPPLRREDCGKYKEDGRKVFELYTTYLLEKAIGLEFAGKA